MFYNNEIRLGQKIQTVNMITFKYTFLIPKKVNAGFSENRIPMLLPLMLFISGILFAVECEARIYKYRAPNGKVLFTDQILYDPTYILIDNDVTPSTAPDKQASTPSAREKKFQSYIIQASVKHGVEISLIKAIIKAESDFDPDAKSRAGAQGLMQLMPKTAKSYNVHNSYNSRQNIDAGTEHIKKLLNKYKNDLTLALAAYNAGETAVNKYGGIPPYPETQRYVKKVLTFKKEFEESK